MKLPRTLPIGLRGLILAFALLAALATLCNSLVVAYTVQRDALIHSTLEANRAYAAKVASSIGEFLRAAQQRLAYSEQIIARDFDNPALLHAEAMRLQAQDADFNAVAITDPNGKVLQAYPDHLKLLGSTLHSEEVQKALQERRPMISHAYTTTAGNMVVFISQPVIDDAGHFLGVIGGSVFLRKKSALHTVITNHFHRDGTYAFVADEYRRLLHHPDPTRIGEVLSSSVAVDAALRGESGAMAVENSHGEPMLAGYAPVADAHWAVVAQQPRDQALATLGQLMRNMVIGLLPASLVGLLLLWIGALLITRPLRQLANAATHLANPDTTARLGLINAWYTEAAAIRQTLIASVQLLQQKLGRLRNEAQSDALTGLANRRAMDSELAVLEQSGRQYSALALDIDHFKRVNDTFGHDAGDVALKQVAKVIQDCSRTGDLACRAGGEEFILLLPETSLPIARVIAERIRATIAATEIPTVGTLTISIGIACHGADSQTAEVILKLADAALYRAKESGRNRVVAADDA
ncbi:GGDEF domain-containing protein [Pseudomonas sp. UL073]|uniref:diguanylate cyclase n=1 Tax=Zestomonas insulae TaxID=2809017 RepID=A0ABS2IBW1_9GAMM|nr:sensor domain-containing diguanylate cyclase [Pseudomonas insulae]MBM7060255.1 GGDEF domain-containing protein [Pseudomonas insulae]